MPDSRNKIPKSPVCRLAAAALLGALFHLSGAHAQELERPPVADPLRWNYLSLTAPIEGGCGEVGLEMRLNPANGRIEIFSLIMEGRPVRIPPEAYADLRYVQTEGLTVSMADGGCHPDIARETLSIVFVHGIPFDANQPLEDDDVEFMMAEIVIDARERIRRHLTTVYRGDFTTEEVEEF